MKNCLFDGTCCSFRRSKNNLFQQFAFAGLLFLTLLCFAFATNAQSDFASFVSRSDFDAVTSSISTIDFESVAPARGFGKHPVNEGLTVNRVGFRTTGGGRFGAGMILVLSEHYAVLNPMTNMGTGAILAWGPPNQPGNDYLDVTLPGGVYAVGADLWTGQPYVSTVDVIATTNDGKTHSITVNTQQRPNSSFGGFVSDKEIVSVRFQLPKGQPWLYLDNFSYGRKAEGANLKSSASVAAQQNTNNDKSATRNSVTLSENPSQKSSVIQPAAPPEQSNNPTSTSNKNSVSTTATGSIAYVRGSKEIRLISPDGGNDRRILVYPDATEVSGINELAWRPDGKEVAFSSGHDEIFSIYDADLYAVKPDGTGLRKLTNAPDRSELARYPKGSVSVTVRNTQPLYQQSQASTGLFIIYVAGADEPQQVLLLPGASKTLVFKSVADFGKHAQAIVAIQGGNRWLAPGTDVQAGRAVKAPDFSITGDGIPSLGAFRPIWRSDGSRVSYRSGLCVVSTAPAATPAVGHTFNPLFGGENPPSGTCAWDWGPTATLANKILYQAGVEENSSNWNIYLANEGAKHPGEKVFEWGDDVFEFLEDLRWLPDGSGFVFSSSSLLDDKEGNITRVDLATKRKTRLTDFKEHWIGQISVSPDGRWIAFERAASSDAKTADIWIVGTDGKNLRLLVKDGWNPAWSR